MPGSVETNSDEQLNDQPTLPIHIDRPVLTQQKLNEWLGQPTRPGPPQFREQAYELAIRTARLFSPECLKSKLQRKSPTESTVGRDNRDDADDAIPKDDRESQTVNPHPCTRYARTLGTWLISFFPFIGILRKYDVKNWFLNDMIAGLTVGIMHVPQGTIAVVSLLTGEFLDKVVNKESHQNAILRELPANQTNLTVSSQVPDTTALRVGYAAALSMTVGLSQIVMGLFRMGGVIRYLSGPMTSGFTFGVAIHVFTSQVTTLLGVKILKPTGLFTVPRVSSQNITDITRLPRHL
ncbi:Prestin [Fasciola gigantica]|uniref:Prestin n=1 Tax=Fasciola gigantica TaxID=46835 RepID=A0A504YYK2_FASGI|nr:Prestin [Fasciola gigantica]